MENYYNVNDNIILIFAKNLNYNNGSIMPRIKNEVIWGINSFLAQNYRLMEIVSIKPGLFNKLINNVIFRFQTTYYRLYTV